VPPIQQYGNKKNGVRDRKNIGSELTQTSRLLPNNKIKKEFYIVLYLK
jgi:hypothetical protein